MFEILFSFVDTVVIENVSQMVGRFANVITPLIGACVVLYALYLAYKSLYEPENLMVMESIKFIASLAVITFIAFNTKWYMDNLVPAVLTSGDQVSEALLKGSASATGGGASLQTMFDTVKESIFKMLDSIDLKVLSGESWLTTFEILLQVIITVLGFIPFLAVATAYLLVAKIMVSFLLILGPLFIMMAFFPSTRSFFQAWTGQCFNYVLLTIMYPLAFTTFLAVLDLTIFAANLSTSTAFMTMIIFFALILLSVQIPTFCSTLSGGIGINGLVGGIGQAAGALGLTAGAKRLGKLAGKGGMGTAKLGGKSVSSLYNMGKGAIKPG